MWRGLVVLFVVACGNGPASKPDAVSGDAAAGDAAGACAPDDTCDDGDPCTVDSCEPGVGCHHVDRSRCAEPACAVAPACAAPDTDGDGFSDAWEDSDMIDLDCNGIDDSTDFHFPHRALHQFGDVVHTGTGTGVVYPTVIDPTMPIASSTVSITITAGGGVGTATFTYSIDGGAASGPNIARPVVDLTGNLRVQFYLSGFVAADTYTFTTSMGASVKVADKNVPNVYLQYDYLDWDAPGAACTTDQDCVAGGTQPNAVCHANACTHNHAPGDPLFRKVVDAFAAHGVTLYIDPVHVAVPHAPVVTFAKATDTDNGPKAICAGADVVAGSLSSAAVSFFDIKYRTTLGGPFDPKRKPVFRYAVFAHANTCLTDDPAATVGNCTLCPADRSTPSGLPHAAGSGISEVPGNDLIVSMASSFNNPLGSVARNPFAEQGVLMHELGHTLGLHHAGDVPVPEFAPNYLSVMNPLYVFSGIQDSGVAGGTTAVETRRRLDYSSHALATLDESALDEASGVSALSKGYTSIVRFVGPGSANGKGPESGAIDWDLDGTIGGVVSVDLDGQSGTAEVMKGFADWPHPTASGGACTTSADCQINALRQQIHDLQDSTVDPHEPCVFGSCVSFSYAFQCMTWGKADAPGP